MNLTPEQEKMLAQRQCKGGVFSPDHKCKRMTDIWPRSGMCEQCRHWLYREEVDESKNDDRFERAWNGNEKERRELA